MKVSRGHAFSWWLQTSETDCLCIISSQRVHQVVAQPRAVETTDGRGGAVGPCTFCFPPHFLAVKNRLSLIVWFDSLQWLTTHEPSTEHDLSGLRNNFNPRARWKSAIHSAVALSRFSRTSARTKSLESAGDGRQSTGSSGGWGAGAASGSEDEGWREAGLAAAGTSAAEAPVDAGPGANPNVMVTEADGPSGDSAGTHETEAERVVRKEGERQQQQQQQKEERPLNGKSKASHRKSLSRTSLLGRRSPQPEVRIETPTGAPAVHTPSNHHQDDEDDSDPRMPGSFDFGEAGGGHGHHHGHGHAGEDALGLLTAWWQRMHLRA